VALFFFTNSLTGSFLPIYFRDQGLNLAQICAIMLLTFILLGFLPVTLLKTIKGFERIVTVGIFTTMLFFVALVFVKSPIILGLAYGVSLATFYPSFNLLTFRLSESNTRARTISLYSSIIPSLTSMAGPATGGLIIESFGFQWLFATSILLYLVTFLLSTRMHYRTEEIAFALPRNRTFAIFFATFIIAGLAETYWIAYPLFVYNISGTVLNMGLVLTATSILIATVTFSVSWISDVKRTRVEFAVIGTILSATWYFGIGFASSMSQIIVLSLISGFANAFRISWSAHLGDSFGRQYYASILVMMEAGLMVGRIVNLMPTYLLISQNNYAGYFMIFGIVTLFMVPLYIASKKTQNTAGPALKDASTNL
jgi:MFS family permease